MNLLKKNFAKQTISNYSIIYMNELFIKKSILLLVTIILVTLPTEAKALDPRVKALITMTGYGTVGGALLGLASQLAFDTGGRSISQGASLGLYAGMIFGGYVVGSYHIKQKGWGSKEEQIFDPKLSPYETPGGGYYQKSNQNLNYSIRQLPATNISDSSPKKHGKVIIPTIYLNLINFQF